MTPEEKQDFRQMEKDIQQIVVNQQNTSNKLDEVLKAIKGDDLGNRGITVRMQTIEDDVKALKDARSVDKAFARVAIWILAAIGAAVIAATVKLLF